MTRSCAPRRSRCSEQQEQRTEDECQHELSSYWTALHDLTAVLLSYAAFSTHIAITTCLE